VRGGAGEVGSQPLFAASFIVIPAEARIQLQYLAVQSWTPAFAGVTIIVGAHWEKIFSGKDVFPLDKIPRIGHIFYHPVP
jgi:hypothetical protein